MANFSSALASRIETSPLFREALANLQQQSLAPLLGMAPKMEQKEAAKLTEAALAFARSGEHRHVELAQEITYALAACDSDSALRGAWRHVLAEIGNFPAGDYISRLPLAEENLPLILKLKEASRRDENTISVLDREIVLTDFQADVWIGLQNSQFLNVSAPTSAGKSFLVQAFLQKVIASSLQQKNIAYLVPSRALIYEVQGDLTRALKAIGDRAVVTSVPQIHEELHDQKSLVFVLTQERMQTVLNETGLVFDMIIVDEAQQIADDERGMLLLGCLETALSRSPLTKVLLITPSSKNARTIAPLLGLPSIQTIVSAVRPVRQNLLFVGCSGAGKERGIDVKLYRPEGSPLSLGKMLTKRSTAKAERLLTSALELGKEGQSIIYASRPSVADTLALKLADAFPESNIDPGSPLDELATFVAKHIHPQFSLAKVLRKGVGVHYGRLPTTISKAVEEYFDAGHIKYLVCTTTLLQGVNLPARNIFLQNPKKGTAGPLEANEFWNLAGRAGRLKRDTHGNVFLIDYEDWDSNPISDEQVTDVEPSICEALGAKQNSVLAFALDSDHLSGQKGFALAESVFSRLFVDARDGTLDQTLSRALSRFPGVDVRDLKSAVFANLEKVTLPTALLRRNALISPLRQQKLYDHFSQQLANGMLESLVPAHPWQTFPNPKVRLETIFRAIHEHLEGRTTNEETYFGWFALSWMRGEPLSSLIANRIAWEQSKADPNTPFEGRKIGSIARNVMEQIETRLRFHYVKYLRCYLDVLQHRLSEIGFEELDIPPIPLFLELGASAKTMVSAMELGMSRIAAMEVSNILPRDRDAVYVRSELKSPHLNKGKLSSFVLRELDRLGLLA